MRECLRRTELTNYIEKKFNSSVGKFFNLKAFIKAQSIKMLKAFQSSFRMILQTFNVSWKILSQAFKALIKSFQQPLIKTLKTCNLKL